jgi:iron complex transport system permease protein
MMAKTWILNASLASLIVIVGVFSLLTGRVWIPAGELWAALRSTGPELASLIFWQLRLPRLVLALEVGAALGLSGAVLQGVTRNPLAEPGLMGVSTGAAFGAVVAIYFGFATRMLAAGPLFGLVGALTASLTTLALGRGGGTIALILAGAAVTALAGAGISLTRSCLG